MSQHLLISSAKQRQSWVIRNALLSKIHQFVILSRLISTHVSLSLSVSLSSMADDDQKNDSPSPMGFNYSTQCYINVATMCLRTNSESIRSGTEENLDSAVVQTILTRLNTRLRETNALVHFTSPSHPHPLSLSLYTIIKPLRHLDGTVMQCRNVLYY